MTDCWETDKFRQIPKEYTMIYADIIVNISHESIDKTFQYSIPEDLQKLVKIGSRVDIPFGNRKGMTGYVVGLSCVPKIAEEKIKSILGISKKSVEIDERMLTLAAWIKEYFGGTMNEALKTVLPVKKSVRPVVKKEVYINCSEETANEALKTAETKHYVAKARLLKELISNKVLSMELVNTKLNIGAQTVTALEKQGLISVSSYSVDRNRDFSENITAFKYELNDEQRSAADKVINDYKEGKHGTYLIHGVTGSGKTEVYLEIIEEVIKLGKQAIVLIPEIALTYQTVLRFTKRFGNRVAFFNSRLSDGERYDQYLKARNGEIDIMIGPRSALFTPFEKLGLIVIDEEHESAYKSEGAPKYHAREVAEKLATMTGSSLVLGSATPSLEAYKKGLSGEYTLLKLRKRAKSAVLPAVEIVDLREELKKKNRSIFSLDLTKAIDDRLKKHEQVILFLNRRGYSGFISCRTCGEAVKCPHCSVSLTQHYDGMLRCHYCGYEISVVKTCPSCGSPYIAGFGTGTQKIEESVKKLFPGARVLRMDADTTKEKESYERILSSFANEEADILIGTQMIVKGHDFPKVTLVGILAADMSLHVSDYRSSERTFQLLAQAAGRAGRDSLKGDVIIQTYSPEHYAISCAAKQDYEGFYEQEIAYRKMLMYPPEGHILAVLFTGPDEAECMGSCQNLTKMIIDKFKVVFDNKALVTVGPAKAYVSKANDMFRDVVYFKSEDYNLLTQVCEMLDVYMEKANCKGIRVQTDFDPMNTY